MFRRLLSFLFPVRIKTLPSAYSGKLYVEYQNGRKTLGATRVNYSFASLHRIMQFILAKTIPHNNEAILMLGLGGGSALAIIREEILAKNPLTTVEIDPAIIAVARADFGVDRFENSEIIQADAYQFVQETQKKFGLIIVDLFINDGVPEQFYDSLFWDALLSLRTPQGRIVFNTMTRTTNAKNFSNIQKKLHEKGVSFEEHYRVAAYNQVIITQ